MTDIICARCGEPWEAYYVYHEMAEWEKWAFTHGKGCPSCVDEEVEEEHGEEFMRTLVENTDEDPIEVLSGFVGC